MDFGSILHAAQKNEKSSGSASVYYKTKFEPPKKENKSRTLSSNIQKFLAKKEEEEKSKVEEAKKKRNELLAMRDTKATNKIKKMLKVIKSANKSVLEDAVDNVNTAVTVNGPDQPDEDDYGYVSQEASAFYSKMMDKYKNIPEEDKKFSSSKKVTNFDLSSTKDRVRAAILRHQEEESLPHKRKRRSHNGTNDRPISPDYSHEEENVKKEEKPKPKRPAPPPLDFNELLKIAEKKQFEPVVETKKPEKTDEPERLMTKKQKREQEELKAFREAKLKRDQEKALNVGESTLMKKPAPVAPPPRPKPTNPLQIRIPKLSDKSNTDTKKPISAPAPSDKNKVSLNDRDRSRNSSTSSKDRSSRDEERKRSETKTDINKNVKQPISKPNAPTKHSEKPAIKLPNNKPSADVRSSSSSGTLNKSKDLNKSDSRSDKKSLPEKSSSDGARSKPQTASGNKSSTNVAKSIPTPQKSFSHPVNQKTPTQLSSSKQIKPEATKDSRKLDPKSRPAPTSKVDDKKPAVSDQKTKPPMAPTKGVALTPRELMQRRLAAEAAKERTNSEVKKTVKPNNPTAQPKVAGKQPASSSSNTVRQFPPADVKSVRQFPPADVKKARQFPPSDMQRSRQFPPQDMAGKREKPRPLKRKILDEDDSEYDSELDDFIDDGPEDKNDYSKYIKEIFGYDKSRYKDADEDDRNMESNFSQVMREEYISKKLGIMEDLEDMKMEAMEKKKKTQTKRRRIDD